MPDERYMRRAIDLASGKRTHPNPTVGAVVVGAESSNVLGEGFHPGPGESHAEVLALREAGQAAAGGTLYVTLEPCAHQGRTPPCVDAIAASGVKRVVIGACDPDPRVAGEGIRRLRAEGITVTEGVLEEESLALDPAYFHHRKTGLPLVTLKYAMTLDGSVAAGDSSSRWITSEAARRDAHSLRAESDAVVVGAGTLRGDDPMLDVRLDGYEGPQPRPVVIAGRELLPGTARIWVREPLVIAAAPIDLPAGRLEVVPAEADGRPDPAASARVLADMGMLSVLLEGGPAIAGAWWRAGLIERGVVYIGAKMGGGSGMSPLAGEFASIQDAVSVRTTGRLSLGDDHRIDFERD